MKKDYEVLKELGKRQAEIAALPVQDEKRELWKAKNSLKPVRPMVLIDQLPWHEINKSDEMKLECEDEFLRSVEIGIRRLLYRWNHFPVDMVVENRIDLPFSVRGLKYGIDIVEDTLGSGDGNDVVSHRYHDEIADEEALEKIKPDKIWVDRALDEKRQDILNDIFHDILPVRMQGVVMQNCIWDRMSQMRPVDNILWDIIDRRDFAIKTAKKFVDIAMSAIDQCEELGILDADLQYIHCSGAYTDELPAEGFDPEKPRAKDTWVFGMAQMFSTVSPQMHDELEIDITMPLYDRFGLAYYGCCEPLDRVIPYIKKIKNVRKISSSPWADVDRSAENMGQDYVLSLKPNPSYVATGALDGGAAKQISQAIVACSRTGTPMEMILKDISTVSGRIEVLDEWAKMAMRLAEG